MATKKWLALGTAGVALMALIGWRVVTKQAQSSELANMQKQRATAPANVTMASSVPRDVLATIDSVGTAETPYMVKLSPKVAGRIDYLQVREGDPVLPGQVLVRIDPSEIQATVLQQRAGLAEARSRYAQAQLTKVATDVGISANVRQQQAGLASAQADYNQNVQNLKVLAASDQAAIADAKARVKSAQAQVRSAQADLDTARANHANAKSKFARMQNLYNQGFAATQDVDDARTAADVAVQVVNGAEQKLSVAESAVESAEQQLQSAVNLAAINARKNDASLEAAKAKLTQSAAGVEVAGANRSQAAAYQANLDALKSAVSAAEGQLQQAQSQLANTILSSPVEGTVTSRNLDPGGLATPGQAVLTIQYLKWLYVTTFLPIEDSPLVHVGMQAQVTFDAIPGRTFVGTLAQINPAADPVSRQFTIKLKLDNKDGILRPGMFGHVGIISKTIHAKVTVPREAVKLDDDVTGPYVFSVDKTGVAHKRPVKLGASDVAGYEILSGLNPGETVVVRSYNPIHDGGKIRLPGQGGQGKGDRGQGAGKQ